MKLSLLLVTFLVTRAVAWSINGHLYVAAIAEKILQEQAPIVLERAQEVLG